MKLLQWRRRAAPWFLGLAVLFGATAVQALNMLTTPAEVSAAMQGLSDEQEQAFTDLLAGVLKDADFAALVSRFDLATATGIDPLTLGDIADALHPVISGLPLIGGLLTFEWETEVNGVTRSHTGVLNVATPLDVDDQIGADVTAKLSLNGTTGITLEVQRSDSGAALPLKIRAIVQDPRSGSDAKFALGYDARHADAPASYTEDVSISGITGTSLSLSVEVDGAGSALALLADELASDKSPRQSIHFDLAPVPNRISAQVDLGDDVHLALNASRASLAILRYVDAIATPAQTLTASIDELPSQLSIDIRDRDGQQDIAYSASALIQSVDISGSNLASLGKAKDIVVSLQEVPQALDLSLGTSNGNFSLDAGNASLGLIEALFTSGSQQHVPAGYDGLLFKDLPGTTVLAARVTQLKRMSGSEEPLSIYLDALAGKPVSIELRSQPSVGAKEVYTTAQLNNLQRHTQISITESGSRQLIHYEAAAIASSLNLATNAGNRQSLTASLSAVPASMDICAAGDKTCSTSGKAGNVASMRVTSSHRATLDLHDCHNNSCSEEIKISNLSFRKVDTSIDVGRNCPWYGCYPQGSKGSIWLDTDNHLLNGTLKYAGADFKVKAGFGPSFRTDNRYVKWSYFAPTSKSGSITCGAGTYLDVTVFGITIDVSGLYLC